MLEKALYKEILNNCPVGYTYSKILLKDETPYDFCFLEINNIFEKFVGIKEENIIGKKYTNILPYMPKTNIDFIKLCGEVALSGIGKEYIEYFNHIGKWYKIKIVSFDKYYFATYFIDVNKEMAKYEELNRFFDINLDLLCIADVEGDFIKLNKAWKSILGYSIDELKNKNFLDFVHPEDIESTLNVISQLTKNLPVVNFINRYRSKDNTYKYIEWHSKSYGNLIYTVARDITDKIQIQQELKETEDNFRSFYETMKDIMFIAAHETNINIGRIEVNKLSEAKVELQTSNADEQVNETILNKVALKNLLQTEFELVEDEEDEIENLYQDEQNVLKLRINYEILFKEWEVHHNDHLKEIAECHDKWESMLNVFKNGQFVNAYNYNNDVRKFI